ncbi:hypothetical protein [Hymenobacter crusticola]|uniref:Uncharacterized protein n=1 Tax=Hymenobacter crusticola TaxID=1770526 RepID=A0A243WGE1_9BACT|nr:hypothetical protein [Hymenobacter crusticola]OUJ74813.1 hypothetical protein BXP70_08640 [Hymenobacter crusticola]
MKKQASPVPTPRAAALSQSASQYAAGAASAWQNIAGNSSRLADANRRANGPGYAPLAPGQAAPPEAPNRRLTAPSRTTRAPGQRPEPQETIRQVGWREVDRAVGMSTKRKYNLFGIGFGPKVPVFETEKVKLPVYQETDRNKRYYAAVKQENVARIKREGFEPEFGAISAAAPKTVGQFNSQGHIYFFSNEISARDYGQKNIDGDYAVVEFVMPEYQECMPNSEGEFSAAKLYTAQSIAAGCITRIK